MKNLVHMKTENLELESHVIEMKSILESHGIEAPSRCSESVRESVAEEYDSELGGDAGAAAADGDMQIEFNDDDFSESESDTEYDNDGNPIPVDGKGLLG